ncbi:L-cystine transmembrane transporter [Aureococcus anophagefferens]|nr:L-cystine transmembrane transporter [Aureococcus anophagefferens]
MLKMLGLKTGSPKKTPTTKPPAPGPPTEGEKVEAPPAAKSKNPAVRTSLGIEGLDDESAPPLLTPLDAALPPLDGERLRGREASGAAGAAGPVAVASGSELDGELPARRRAHPHGRQAAGRRQVHRRDVRARRVAGAAPGVVGADYKRDIGYHAFFGTGDPNLSVKRPFLNEPSPESVASTPPLWARKAAEDAEPPTLRSPRPRCSPSSTAPTPARSSARTCPSSTTRSTARR